ncbi:7-cyano-7-deazaguanine synthase [Thalassotalea sp. LPB0316]|uniref:asparagine synthase-related protein n=1 Tax=Thalassotalea sp. LPB0316 TaxID=2769490 RepID=UPI0018692187|nr:asparagine synthetase B family protein [Thalassotalea sp. LPB0316]QOL26498.1 7-cyano-7-deazaguanine synthase [Thalassotalea sp. LPB0316]
MTSFALSFNQDNQLISVTTKQSQIDVEGNTSDIITALDKLCINYTKLEGDALLIWDGKPIGISHSDITQALKAGNYKPLHQTDGHFSFCLIESSNVYFANDRFGAKTWYWQRQDNTLLISTAQQLQPIDNKAFNTLSERECFKYRWITQQRTLHQSIDKLRYASVATLNKLSINQQAYFELPRPNYRNDARQLLVEKTQAALQGSLDKASLEYSCVAVFLSGGVDSSILAALSQKTFKKIYVITPVFEFGENPELATAKHFAQVLNIEPILVSIKESDLIADLKQLIEIKREPLRHYSSLALMAMMRAVPNDAQAVVYGEAADTLFGSNGMKRLTIHSKWHSRLKNMPNFALSLLRLIKPEKAKLLKSIKSKRILDIFSQLTEIQYSASSKQIIAEYLNTDDLEVHAILKEPEAITSNLRFSAQKMIIASDVQKHFEEMEYIASLFNKAVISPFFDTEVIKISSELSDTNFFGESHVKPVLRELACQYFPRETIYQKKYGFPVPMIRWLEEPLKELVEAVYHEAKLFDGQAVRRLEITKDYELVWFFINWQLLHQHLEHIAQIKS